jgi:hypothetical protein
VTEAQVTMTKPPPAAAAAAAAPTTNPSSSAVQPRTAAAATGPMAMSIPRRDPVAAGQTRTVAGPALPPPPSQRQRPKPPPATALPQQQQQQPQPQPQHNSDKTVVVGTEGATQLRAGDVARAITADASSVAYVYDRGIDLDAHAPEISWNDGAGADGTATDAASNANMYALLRSWVQDDPHRRVVEGDLMDYETVQVPVFVQPKMHQPTNSTATSTPGADATLPGVWSCLAECRKRQNTAAQQPHAPSVPTTTTTSSTSDLPDLSTLSRERTEKYREQRKAHKRALRAKDRHVLEAMRKRGIHLEPSMIKRG